MRFLFKRGHTWTFKKLVDRQIMQVSLATEDEELAKVKRDEMLKHLANEEIEKIRGPRTRTATIGDVLTAYRMGIKKLSDRLELKTVVSNANNTRSFLRWALGTKGERNATAAVDLLPTDILTPATVAKFKENYLASAGPNHELRETRRRGAASILRHTRSVFAEKCAPLYRGMVMPNLESFRGACQLRAENRVHLPIKLEVMEQMHTAMEALHAAKPELWLVHTLHKFTGLRNEELCEARVEWFNRAPWGQVYLSVMTRPYFEPKGSSGHVPIHSSVAALLSPFVQGKQPEDYVINASSKTARAELVNRDHAIWIRQFLPAAQYVKAGYELRRWGAQKMDEKYGKEAAEAFLRHMPQTVAERHYFERWYPWRRLGDDVGITLADARGDSTCEILGTWQTGAAALQNPKAEGSQRLNAGAHENLNV